MEIPEELPEIDVDQQLFMQIFVNLIDNAIKYTPDGGTITVSAETDTSIYLKTRYSFGRNHLACSRYRNWNPMESQSRVFERFYRVDKDVRKRWVGTGLGLAIVKHIVLRHNGRIWLDSILGQGSIFHVTVPLSN